MQHSISPFFLQLNSLPTKVSGHDSVQGLLDQVEKFKKEATKFLDMDPNEAARSETIPKEMNKCIEAGLNLDVELEELNELKTRHEQGETWEGF